MQIGRQFGLLTITAVAATRREAREQGRKKPRLRYTYTARCACGVEVQVKDTKLYGADGRKSCGRHTPTEMAELLANTRRFRPVDEARALHLSRFNTKSDHPLYSTWQGMFRRCYRPEDPAYPAYGGRGIRVAAEWQDFWKFVTSAGERPEGTTVGRIDNDGHYVPDNCRWETPTLQANNRRGADVYTWQGAGRTLAEWARHWGVERSHIAGAMKLGIPFRVIAEHASEA